MKYLVVTGAARGFGREIALKAHQMGYQVMASVRRFDDAAKSLQTAGIRCEELELNDAASITAFADKVKDWCNGTLFALINNAGIAYPAPMELIEHKDLVSQFQVNAFGHIQLTQRLLDVLRASKGRIIMMSSQSAILSAPMVGAYSASKRALEALTEALVMEIGSDVTVNIIRPGPYATSIWESSTKIGERYDYENSAYKPLALAIQKLSTSRGLPPASGLADVTLHVLESENTRFIYGAPFSSRVTMLLRRLLPNRLFFRLVSFVISREIRKIEPNMKL